MNLGDVVIDGDDIFGDGVNVAARLEGQAEKNGVLISDAVHVQVRGKVNLAFIGAGELALKNIELPVRVWRWRGDGSPVQATIKMASGTGEIPSIAVLPFTNMSGDPEQEFFCDGLVEQRWSHERQHRYLSTLAVGPARRGRLARARAVVKKHPDDSETGYFLAVEAAFENWEAMQNACR